MKNQHFFVASTITAGGIRAKMAWQPMITDAERLLVAVGRTDPHHLPIVAQFAQTLISEKVGVEFVSFPDMRITPSGIVIADIAVASMIPAMEERFREKSLYVVAEGYEGGSDYFAGVTVLPTLDPSDRCLAYYVCTRDMLPAVRKRGVPR